MKLKSSVALCVVAALLAGCGPKPVASVKGGECKAFQRVAAEACGITLEDQYVLDDFVETGVSACKWARPAPRTPSCADLRVEIAELRQFKATALAGVMPVKAPPLLKEPSRLKRAWQKIRGK